jgi:hypothetical protein
MKEFDWETTEEHLMAMAPIAVTQDDQLGNTID